MFEYLITRPMGFIIEHIYNLVSNYGLAIIIFTILIKLILIPLNIHSQKAMKKQQKIQPLMAELQKKYANDQEKLQREMMKIYKENNISMTGGCLPMLIQMPILIGLYQVIQKPLSYLAGVDWANASVINEVIRLKDAMVNLGYNIGNLANATMEQLANNSQIQLSKWAGIVGTQGTALEGVSGGVHPWVLNFNFLGLDLSNAPSAAFGHIMALDFSNIIAANSCFGGYCVGNFNESYSGTDRSKSKHRRSGCSNDKVNESYDAGNDSVLYSYTSGRSWIVLDYKLSCTNSSAVDTKCFFR